MVNFHIYKAEDLPENLKIQIVDFLRMEWPDGFMGANRLRNWISHEYEHPVNFILEEEGILISHLEVVWKELEHHGSTYRVYGLTGVLTYPQFRRQGYGLQLLHEAKKYIEQQDGVDLVMFNSDKVGFYDKAGFMHNPKIVTLVGDPKNPEKETETAFTLFISDKGKAAQTEFEEFPVYVGDHTW